MVVNDGSIDATARIAAQYARLDPRIQVITKKNEGISAARNLGLVHALGDYVAFLDADDLWHPAKIERQMEFMLAPKVPRPAAVYTLYRTIDCQDRLMASGTYWRAAGGVATHLATMPVGNGSSILVRRDAALAVGGFDASLAAAEDLDFELKLVARFLVGIIPEYLVGYRQHEGSMSSDPVHQLRSATAVIEKHIRLNPGLSQYCLNLARGSLYHYYLCTYLGRRDYKNALKMLGRLITTDPVLATRQLFWLQPQSLARRIARAAGCRRQGPLFYEVSPLKPGPLPYLALRMVRLPYLAREDAVASTAVRMRRDGNTGYGTGHNLA